MPQGWPEQRLNTFMEDLGQINILKRKRELRAMATDHCRSHLEGI